MKSLSFFFISLSTLFTISNARKLNVGGSGAWVPNPPENYQSWSGRNRFLIHDTLYFSYAKGADSVLEVNKADFDGCNTKNPIKRVDDGESQISLDRYGPFYFISGNEDNCKKGQKLAVVVISAKTAQPPHAASPGGAHSPESSSTLSPTTSPPGSMAPKSFSPISPSSAPMTSPPAPMAPESSSTLPPSSAPVTSPPGPMAPESPSLAPEVSSTSSPPSGSAMGPSGDGPSASGDIATPAGAPGGENKSSANGLAVMSIITIVVSLVLTIFMSV